MKRGEVVIVDFPFSDQSGSKRRPALVVQADSLNQRIRETILASISTTANGSIPTHVLIDPKREPNSGLNADCGVQYEKLLVVDQHFIKGIIGDLAEQTMRQIDECLKKALGLL
jgi:mRNA interferase MazF